jgi:hypothetical protein
MQAVGARLLDDRGDDLPPGGGALARLDRIDLSGVEPRLASARIRIAADVTNTLCGSEGAAAVFAPQKGASPADVVTLEAALRQFAEVVRAQCGIDLLSMRGGGAAGGIAAGRRSNPALRSSPTPRASTRASRLLTSSSPVRAVSMRRRPSARPRPASRAWRAHTASRSASSPARCAKTSTRAKAPSTRWSRPRRPA